MNRYKLAFVVPVFVAGLWIGVRFSIAADATKVSTADTETPNVDWNQWGGDSMRNNTPVGHDIPTEWEIGDFDHRTGEWDKSDAKNIKWVARLGSPRQVARGAWEPRLDPCGDQLVAAGVTHHSSRFMS